MADTLNLEDWSRSVSYQKMLKVEYRADLKQYSFEAILDMVVQLRLWLYNATCPSSRKIQ